MEDLFGSVYHNPTELECFEAIFTEELQRYLIHEINDFADVRIRKRTHLLVVVRDSPTTTGHLSMKQSSTSTSSWSQRWESTTGHPYGTTGLRLIHSWTLPGTIRCSIGRVLRLVFQNNMLFCSIFLQQAQACMNNFAFFFLLLYIVLLICLFFKNQALFHCEI